jgi:hypothetical protein
LFPVPEAGRAGSDHGVILRAASSRRPKDLGLGQILRGYNLEVALRMTVEP